MRPITVGMDWSDCGRAAVELGTGLAVSLGRPLRLVHVMETRRYPLLAATVGGRETEVLLRKGAQRMLEEGACVASREHPGLDTSTRLVRGSVVPILRQESRSAFALVLGSHGTGRLADVVVGSTTLHLSSLAHCPVIAVPRARHGVAGGPWAGPGDIVVGIDASPGALAAVAFAMDLAEAAGGAVRAVHAGRAVDPELEHTVAEVASRHPDVRFTVVARRGDPAGALLDEDTGARLVVVGNRGRAAVTSLVLGSVSHAVMHRARGPVAVVPAAVSSTSSAASPSGIGELTDETDSESDAGP